MFKRKCTLTVYFIYTFLSFSVSLVKLQNAVGCQHQEKQQQIVISWQRLCEEPVRLLMGARGAV